MTESTITIRKGMEITLQEYKDAITHYKNLPHGLNLCMLGSCKNKDEIVIEIKKLSEFGKAVLVMHFKFKKFEQKIKDQKK